ncbi:unnamed protein product [Strongylus vulgaris]|uniref:Uncharacterized protein n=1 Tax=Strongylus vulgaris TaxID=40348 RepID=A0A3P7HWT1_STRVU|nr:unnamed protein product [Strongylus vulgaris]
MLIDHNGSLSVAKLGYNLDVTDITKTEDEIVCFAAVCFLCFRVRRPGLACHGRTLRAVVVRLVVVVVAVVVVDVAVADVIGRVTWCNWLVHVPLMHNHPLLHSLFKLHMPRMQLPS